MIDIPTTFSFTDWSNAQIVAALGAALAGALVREVLRIAGGFIEISRAAGAKLKDRALAWISTWWEKKT